jgi:ABC-type transporter Mla MlaB component
MSNASLNISGSSWSLEGPLTFETVGLLTDKLDASNAAAQNVSLARVSEVDSSAVAFLVALKRRHKTAQFHDVPPALTTLTELYGVKELLS